MASVVRRPVGPPSSEGRPLLTAVALEVVWPRFFVVVVRRPAGLPLPAPLQCRRVLLAVGFV